MKGVLLMKKLLKNDTFKVFLYSLGFCTLMFIFNNIADIYNMSTIHRCISILSISFTHVFFVPLYILFNKELHK